MKYIGFPAVLGLSIPPLKLCILCIIIKLRGIYMIRNRNCEIMQYVEFAPHLTEEFILKTIEKHACIKQYAFIYHDKDKLDDGFLKKKHLHLFLHFSEAQKFSDVASWFKIDEQFVNKVKTRFNNAVLYLVHAHDCDKYQYPASSVICNFDFKNLIDDDTFANHPPKLDSLDFDKHSIAYYQKLYYLYPKFMRDVTYCYNIWLTIKGKEYLNMNKQVMYLYGGTGVGKTTLAKLLGIQTYGKDEVFITSSSNDPLDGYQGEKCIILDDFREDCFELSDLLKFLDNNTSSSVKSRYYNKNLVRCEMVIITSINPIFDLYKYSKEDIHQLYRRIRIILELHNNDNHLIGQFYSYDDSSSKYLPNVSIDYSNLLKVYLPHVHHSFSVEDVVKSFSDCEKKLTAVEDDSLPF